METPAIHKTLIAAQTAANVSGTVDLAQTVRQIGFHVAWGANTTTGAVTVEVADSTSYTGTWATQTTVTFTGTAPNQQYYTATAIALAWRARISTVVGPSSSAGVTVTVVGN
jgi:hypothetical protein